MNEVVCYDIDGNILDHLTQWDTGQKIVVKSAKTTSVPEFHFCNPHSKEALVVSSIIDGESIIAEVPNVLLQEAFPITVYMYYETDDESAETVYTITIPVSPRKRPADYTYENGRPNNIALLERIYPVGAIYFSMNSISPDNFLIGKWESVKDSLFVSAGDTYTAGSTGTIQIGSGANVMNYFAVNIWKRIA